MTVSANATGEMPEALPDPYIGKTIDDRYVVEALLGEGGMGVVYRGRHKIIDKTVAIKVLRPELARTTESTARFLQEAKAASRIGNPHIVDISDFGTLPDGSAYFVMEFLAGRSLADLIANGRPLPLARIITLAKQIAEGLSAAHAAGIVHRDLKPDNVMVLTRGSGSGATGQDFVKILDFGIAKVASDGSRLTKAGSIFGTPQYMAPEQAGGGAVDARTDVYALGIILYEMASGKVPFEGDSSMGVLTQQMHAAPVPLLSRVPAPDVSAGFDAVVLRCLAKKPYERYASMGALLAELEKLEQGKTPDALAPSGPPPSSPSAEGTAIAGEAFGKYVLERRLGVDSVTEVFLCRLPGFEQGVAVKRALASLSQDPDFVRAFLDGATVAADLNHPNIVHVFEVDSVEEVPYLAMEYVPGPSLSQLLLQARKSGGVHFGHVAQVLSSMAAGLHYAHDARDPAGHPLQLVHRALSPQKVVVSLEGVPKLLDFGAARARRYLAATHADASKGNTRYTAPELTLGREVDHRADIFAMGVCLYFATTAHYPFDGENDLETRKAVAAGVYAPPSSLVPGYPLQLEGIISGMLRPDPGDRTPTAAAVHEQLDAFLKAGEYASSTKALAAWVNELFPDFEQRQTAVVGGTTLASASPSASASKTPLPAERHVPGVRSSPPTGSSPSVSSAALARADAGPWKSIALVVGAGALVAGIFVAARGGPVGAPATPAAPALPTPGAPIVPAPTPTTAQPLAPATPTASGSGVVAADASAAATRPKPPRRGASTPAPSATATSAPARPCTSSWTPDSPLPPCN